jgi:3-deoxy-D-manno-octulosonate 8-phosphate phosphatase (KDO 8-P phosphatase)
VAVPDKALLQSIRLLVLDVDGTMTDGRLYFGNDGEAFKAFDVRDGHALRLLAIHGGVKLAILTGRNPELVQARARELQIAHVVGRSRAKGKAIEQLCADAGEPLSATAYMGDDVNDLPALRKVALSLAPADAAPEVVREVHYVTTRRAGRGAVREVCELLLGATVGWPPPDSE